MQQFLESRDRPDRHIPGRSPPDDIRIIIGCLYGDGKIDIFLAPLTATCSIQFSDPAVVSSSEKGREAASRSGLLMSTPRISMTFTAECPFLCVLHDSCSPISSLFSYTEYHCEAPITSRASRMQKTASSCITPQITHTPKVPLSICRISLPALHLLRKRFYVKVFRP